MKNVILNNQFVKNFLVTSIFSVTFLQGNAALAANTTCSLAGNPACTGGSTVSGFVNISADSGYDIEIDGAYVGTNSYLWDTSQAKAGAHQLSECSDQSQDVQTCSEEWVPNLVTTTTCTEDYIDETVTNWVDTGTECVATEDQTTCDEDGNCTTDTVCTDYEDTGYWESETVTVDAGTQTCDSTTVDEGSYENVCTDSTEYVYTCENPLNVTVQAPAIQLSADVVSGSNMTTLPRTMSITAAYAVASCSSPNDSATYTVDYGDGSAHGNMSFQGVGCPEDASGSPMATWIGSNHVYSQPGEYIATLYRNGVSASTYKMVVVSAPSSVVSATQGNAPLAVTFNVTGGCAIDYGDGSAVETWGCGSGSTWFNTKVTRTHTYTKPGYHQAIIKYDGFAIYGAGISVITGNITSISPTSGPPGTIVTLTGSGFALGGKINFMDLGVANGAEFEFTNYSVNAGGTIATFTVPSTYTMACAKSSGANCTPPTANVPTGSYKIGFDAIGFNVGNLVQFQVTPAP